MAISAAGKVTPRIRISRSRYTRFVLCMEPGDCTTMILSNNEGENWCMAAKLLEINEWEAPESNKTIAGMLLTENIPLTTSRASHASSAEIW